MLLLDVNLLYNNCWTVRLTIEITFVMRHAKVYCNFAWSLSIWRQHLLKLLARVFMDKTTSNVYCFLQSKCSVYFNKIMKSKHMLWEYRILFVSKLLQICMKLNRLFIDNQPLFGKWSKTGLEKTAEIEPSLLTSLAIHNKPVILAILICEKYLMSNCPFLVGNNLFNHSSSVQRWFWRCLDVCTVYLFLVKSRGAEEPN